MIKIAVVGYSYISLDDHFIIWLTALLEYLNGDGGTRNHKCWLANMLQYLLFQVIRTG